MVQRATTITGAARHAEATAQLEEAFARIRQELDLPLDFPAAVLAEAEEAAAAPRLPEKDERAVPFVTIDPPGSMDLDQAMHIERARNGYRVRYAIADVPAFVRPGGAVDAEARLRGQTVYCPDTRVPLHPEVLSEDGASLLPGAERPAYVWDMVLDGDGGRRTATVFRAMVRSTRRYTYEEVQGLVDSGSAEETLTLLQQVGRLRLEREAARGGASLPMPEQEVHVDEGGSYRLEFRPLRPSEDWNAQISLLAGMVAAGIMLEGGVGILRTMPAADRRDVDRLRRQARALGVAWPDGMGYGDFLRTLDRQDPRHLAVVHDATSLFRGAGYTPFDGEPPEQPEQAALAAPYAHVTAPLRRLVDRYGLAVCEALANGGDVPGWAREALPVLPGLMRESDRRAKAVERACTDAVEAVVLRRRVGERFDAVVVDEHKNGDLVVQLTDPAVTGLAAGTAQAGDEVEVELTQSDVSGPRVRFVVHEVTGRQ